MRIGNNATLASAMALGIATLSTATLSNANGLALAASDHALTLVDHHLSLADTDLTLDAAAGGPHCMATSASARGMEPPCARLHGEHAVCACACSSHVCCTARVLVSRVRA